MRNLIHELVTHYGALRKQLMRELKDPHHAADIAQASFERVYVQTLSTHAVEGDGAADGDKARIESPRALLFRVARNLCIDEARKRKVAHDSVARTLVSCRDGRTRRDTERAQRASQRHGAGR